MTTIGYATLDVIPSFKGIQQKLTSGMVGPSGAAGTAAGNVAGQKFGQSLFSRAKSLVAPIGALFAAKSILDFGKDAFAEAQEAAKVGALTTQVIKSTGGAAKVTAAQVGDLAEAISEKVGVDDEAIQSGENMLLTFKNIRNEAGAGNDIFNQSTQILTDMSAAMGTDMKSSAIQLGKALNDPIKGVTALTRVGVTFTDAQKAQIKALVEAGDTMGAQKIILGELSTEFGGAAEAMATPADKARVTWANFKEYLGTQAMPLFNKLLGWVTKGMSTVLGWFQMGGQKGGWLANAWAKMGKIGATVFSAVRAVVANVFAGVRKWIDDNRDRFALWGAKISELWNKLAPLIIGAAKDIGTWLGTNLPKAIGFLGDAIGKIAGWMSTIITYFREHKDAAVALQAVLAGLLAGFTAFKIVSTIIRGIAAAQAVLNAVMAANPIGLVVIAIAALVAGFIYAYKHSETFREIVTKAFDAVKAAAQAVADFFTQTIPALWNNVLTWTTDTWTAIVTWLTVTWDGIKAKVSAVWSAIVAAITGFWTSIKAIISGALTTVKGWISTAWENVKTTTSTAWEGVKTAVSTKTGELITFVAGIPGKIIGALGNLGALLYGAGQDVLQGLWDGMVSIWNKITGWLSSITDKLPDWKGPPAKDRKILYGSGEMVMDGFRSGLEKGLRGVRDTLRGATNDLNASIPGGSYQAGSVFAGERLDRRSAGRTTATLDDVSMARIERALTRQQGPTIGSVTLITQPGETETRALKNTHDLAASLAGIPR